MVSDIRVIDQLFTDKGIFMTDGRFQSVWLQEYWYMGVVVSGRQFFGLCGI